MHNRMTFGKRMEPQSQKHFPCQLWGWDVSSLSVGAALPFGNDEEVPTSVTFPAMVCCSRLLPNR